MPTLKTIKKSRIVLVAAALALVSGATSSQPAQAGWKLCVKQQCTSAMACECPDGKEHVGTLNSTSDGGNF